MNSIAAEMMTRHSEMRIIATRQRSVLSFWKLPACNYAKYRPPRIESETARQHPMPKVFFTQNLQRHMDTPRGQYVGTTVKEALDSVFQTETVLRGYVLDEQGRLRQHVVVFVDGQPVRDRVRLSDALREQSEVWVMQALSGE